MTLICAKFDTDLINISKVTSRKTKWPRFLADPVMSIVAVSHKVSVCCVCIMHRPTL